MNPQDHIPRPDNSIDEIDLDAAGSVDDFIKELEAKERDLHITSDLSIEIEESEFDMAVVPEGIVPPPASTPPPVARPKADLDVSLYNSRPQSPSMAGSSASLNTKARNFDLEREVAELKLRINELKHERAEIQEKSDRRLKDFENYKYRLDRERRGAFIDQISNLAAQMLPVLDNLDRAIDSVPRDADMHDPAFKHFFDGIVLVNQQVSEVFTGMGVEAIRTVGEQFDPNFHEAVAIEDDPASPPNTIVQEMLRGYKIGNKVVRHSMVKVTAGGTRPQAPAQEPEPQPDPIRATDEEIEALNSRLNAVDIFDDTSNDPQ